MLQVPEAALRDLEQSHPQLTVGQSRSLQLKGFEGNHRTIPLVW